MYLIKKKSFFPIMVILFTILLSGCSVKHFSGDPINNVNLQKDIELLRNKSSLTNKYNVNYPTKVIKISEIKKLWGEPIEKKEWSSYILFYLANIGLLTALGLPITYFAIPVVVSPVPNTQYTWTKQEYSISAHTTRQIAGGYKERILNWTWDEKRSNKTSNDE